MRTMVDIALRPQPRAHRLNVFPSRPMTMLLVDAWNRSFLGFRRAAIAWGCVQAYVSAMADCCCTPPPLDFDTHRGNAARYRRVLWAVLAINAVMFVVEVGAGLAAKSASLQADALDFL